ncbi:MAG: chromosomal replication initiator protein DnaA [Candidatus Eisenbacteria bacterium]|nr:chromosomal replication initiator protein DnaA [Candidatus Eisenbacteria bacterium]
MSPQPVDTSVWANTLEWIRDRVSGQRFETWFSRMRPLEIENDRILIEVPNPFFIEWFERHNLPLLREALRHSLGSGYTVQWRVQPEYYRTPAPDPPSAEMRPAVPAPDPAAVCLSRTPLNPRYSFENFVVGRSNEFSHAACRAVARDPGRAYNPLFIHGSTGLGKTHLMQAIGNALLCERTRCRVVYVYCEKFMNELIEAISSGDTAGFRQRYRNLDVLLIDDIHFLGGREATQEEFFHTFNALHDGRKQIVMTSDRPPKEIENIELRLLSRFSWGLVSDISPPSLETRLAILHRRASVENLSLPDDVALLIANQVRSNVRVLEGSLVKLAALSRLLQAELSVDLAQDVLKDVVDPDGGPRYAPPCIQETVARFFDVPSEALRGKRRTSRIATARQVAMYLCRKHTSLTLNDIGRSFGHRDHSTVLHACGKVARQRVRDSQLESAIHAIEDRLETESRKNRGV